MGKQEMPRAPEQMDGGGSLGSWLLAHHPVIVFPSQTDPAWGLAQAIQHPYLPGFINPWGQTPADHLQGWHLILFCTSLPVLTAEREKALALSQI